MSVALPDARRDAVSRALQATFGATEPDGAPIRLAGGLSGATLLKIRVGGIPYVLRLEPEGQPHVAVSQAYGCMQAAARAMVAPRVWWADAADGVAITDFLEAKSLAQGPPEGARDLIVELGQTLRALHNTRGFPAGEDYLSRLDGVVGRYRAQPLLDPGLTAEAFDRFDAVRGTYRVRPEDRVASHNDLNPGTVMHDGRRLWLVDWESAFLADRFADLASVANWFAPDPAAEARLLTTYFRGPPNDEQGARFEVMKAVNHLFYGVIFLIGAAAERPDARIGADVAPPPRLAELRQRLGTGRLTLSAWEDRVLSGRARLVQALEDMRGARFDAALAQASG